MVTSGATFFRARKCLEETSEAVKDFARQVSSTIICRKQETPNYLHEPFMAHCPYAMLGTENLLCKAQTGESIDAMATIRFSATAMTRLEQLL